MESLGLRLDLVCMTLPRVLEGLAENFARYIDLDSYIDNEILSHLILVSLRSTSLCSSTSYRDSGSLTDEDQFEVGSIEEDVRSGCDVLAHLPEYQVNTTLSLVNTSL